jgi:hypothetical protein
MSVVDALIQKLEIDMDKPIHTGHDQEKYQFAIEVLEDLKKEAITIQPSIPLSVIDAFIKEYEECENGYLVIDRLQELEEIKKEAI